MSIDELEAEALKLGPQARARLAERLLDSLENLSDDENARLWGEEAERREAAWDAKGGPGRSAADVFRDAKSRLS
jgi:broad specificity phosphatase PhoE